MVAEIRAEWVKRLRSGDYKKGSIMLHNTGTGAYCPLGVLCEIAADAGVITRLSDGTYQGHEADAPWFAFPPIEVNGWAGLTIEQMSEVCKVNDGSGMTFAEMADKIEREL